MELKIKKLKSNAKIPMRATDGSAGMDLYACIDEPVTLAPGELAVVQEAVLVLSTAYAFQTEWGLLTAITEVRFAPDYAMFQMSLTR